MALLVTRDFTTGVIRRDNFACVAAARGIVTVECNLRIAIEDVSHVDKIKQYF